MYRATIAATLALAVLAGLALPAGADETSTLLKNVASKNTNSLATVQFKVRNEINNGLFNVSGLAICVSPEGVLITAAMDTMTPVKAIEGITLRLPNSTKEISATLMGMDRQTGLTFIQAAEGATWTPVVFKETSGLGVGDQVVSVGLMGEGLNNTPYLGVGYVSANLRAPEHLAFVTGGLLTSVGSPVFNSSGNAVGIVSRQLYQGYQLVLNEQQAQVALRGREQTSFFTPVEEFIQSLKAIPTGQTVRRQSWIGVLEFKPLPKETATGLLRLDVPGVLIGKVVDDTPASRAGLQDSDVVIGLNGQNLEGFPTPEMTAQNLRRTIERLPAGKDATLSIIHGTERKSVTLKVEPLPPLPQEAPRVIIPQLGMLLREKVKLDRYTSNSASAKKDGLYVFPLGQDSPAYKAAMRPNDLVLNINTVPVTTVAEAERVIKQAIEAKPNEPITFMVQQDQQVQTIRVQPLVRR